MEWGIPGSLQATGALVNDIERASGEPLPRCLARGTPTSSLPIGFVKENRRRDPIGMGILYPECALTRTDSDALLRFWRYLGR